MARMVLRLPERWPRRGRFMHTASLMTPLSHRLGRALAYTVALAAFAGAAWSVYAWQPAVWASAHVQRAQLQAHASNTDAARATYRELLRRAPDARDARWQLIQLELADRRLEQAYLEAKAYTELFPQRDEGWLLVAGLMNAGGLLDEAEAAADQAVAAAPDALEARALRARIRLRRGKFFGARADAQATHTRWPDSAPLKDIVAQADAAMRGAPPAPQASLIHRAARRERGELTEGHAMVWPGPLAELRRDSDDCIQKKDWPCARDIARRARARYPGSVIGPWIAGVSEMAQEHFTVAERYFNEALVAAPRSALITKGLAQAWARQGNATAAGDKLMERVRGDPGFAFGRRHAANLYLNARRPDLAEAVLREAIASPGDAGAYRDLAAFYGDVDRAGDALQIAEQGLARYPQDLELQSLAASLLARGDAPAAIAKLEVLLKAAPDRTTDAVTLANLLLENPAGRTRARELLRQVEFDAPTELEDVAGLGWALFRAGDAVRAVPWLEAASRAAPDELNLRYRLAAAYAQAGRRKDALAHLDFALAGGKPFSEQPAAQKLRQHLLSSRGP